MLVGAARILDGIMGTYGERLSEAIRLANCDRSELAAALGISVQAVSQVIAGKTKALTADNSARAARFLQVDHYWLATGDGAPKSEDAVTTSGGWPFRRVEVRRVEALDLEERAFVEAKLETAIEAAEARIGARKRKSNARG